MHLTYGKTRERYRVGMVRRAIQRVPALLAVPLAVVLVLSLALWATPAALASIPSDVQDVYQEPSTVISGFVWSAQSVTQTFTAGKDGQLDRVSLYLAKHGSGIGNHAITVQIFAAQGGKATGTALAQATIPASEVYNDDPGASGNPSVSWVDTYFTSYLPIQAGSQYALVVSSAILDVETCDGGAQCSYYKWDGLGFKTFVILGAETTTALSSANPTSVSYGTSSVDLTATVSGTSGDAEGAISFAVTSTDGQTTYCSTAPETIGTDGSATGTCDFTTQPVAGTYSITATYSDPATENYAPSSTIGTLSITLGTPSFAFDLSGVTDKTFGDASFSIASDATSNSNGAISFSVDATSSGCTVTSTGTVTITGAGTCVVNASLAVTDSYAAAGPIQSSFAIAKAKPTIDWPDNLADITYGTGLSGTQLDAVAKGVDGKTLTGSYTYTAFEGDFGTNRPGVPAKDGTVLPYGFYFIFVAFTPDDTTNYIPVTDNFTTLSGPSVGLMVNQAPLTITANDQSMAYRDSLPELTWTASGWVNGDGLDSLVTKPGCSTDATSNSPVGPYQITCSGGVAQNYSISYKPGTLTITPDQLTIAANDQSMVLGDSLPTFNWASTGWVSGEGPANLTVQPTCTTTATAESPIGSYPITCGDAVAPNYTISYQPGTLTIGYAAEPPGGSPSAARRGFWAVVELQVTDAQGNDLSRRGLAVTAENLAPAGQPWDGRHGNFVHAFQYGRSFGGHGHGRPSGGYRLMINTRNLSPGDYTLSFTIEGDPMIHTVTIRVLA